MPDDRATVQFVGADSGVVESAGLRQAAVVLVRRALAGRPDPEAGESYLPEIPDLKRCGS